MRASPYQTTSGKAASSGFAKCQICKSVVHQAGSHCKLLRCIQMLKVFTAALIPWIELHIKSFFLANYYYKQIIISKLFGILTDLDCQQCAYKKGICAMCGIKILDTKNYRWARTMFHLVLYLYFVSHLNSLRNKRLSLFLRRQTSV